jgi:hypothetical protein
MQQSHATLALPKRQLRTANPGPHQPAASTTRGQNGAAMTRLTLTVALPEGCSPEEQADIEAILHKAQTDIHIWSDEALACLHCNMAQEVCNAGTHPA